MKQSVQIAPSESSKRLVREKIMVTSSQRQRWSLYFCMRYCNSNSVLMSEKVNQLCKIIASNPAKINLLNDAIKLGLAAPQPSVFKPIVDLLR